MGSAVWLGACDLEGRAAAPCSSLSRFSPLSTPPALLLPPDVVICLAPALWFRHFGFCVLVRMGWQRRTLLEIPISGIHLAARQFAFRHVGPERLPIFLPFKDSASWIHIEQISAAPFFFRSVLSTDDTRRSIPVGCPRQQIVHHVAAYIVCVRSNCLDGQAGLRLVYLQQTVQCCRQTQKLLSVPGSCTDTLLSCLKEVIRPGRDFATLAMVCSPATILFRVCCMKNVLQVDKPTAAFATAAACSKEPLLHHPAHCCIRLAHFLNTGASNGEMGRLHVHSGPSHAQNPVRMRTAPNDTQGPHVPARAL